jgi:hypothetical protein
MPREDDEEEEEEEGEFEVVEDPEDEGLNRSDRRKMAPIQKFHKRKRDQSETDSDY